MPIGKPQPADHGRRAQPSAAGRGRHHVALAVHGVQVSGVAQVGVAEAEVPNLAGFQLQRPAIVLGHVKRGVRRNAVPEIAGPHLKRRLLTNQPAALGGIVLREQLIERHVVEAWVAVVGLAVGEGQLGALNHRVQVLRRVVAHRLQVELLQQGQLLQEHRALGPAGALEDIQTVVVQADRLFEARLPFGEVFIGQQARVSRSTGVLNRVWR